MGFHVGEEALVHGLAALVDQAKPAVVAVAEVVAKAGIREVEGGAAGADQGRGALVG
jgi:hypothetical protein